MCILMITGFSLFLMFDIERDKIKIEDEKNKTYHSEFLINAKAKYRLCVKINEFFIYIFHSSFITEEFILMMYSDHFLKSKTF